MPIHYVPMEVDGINYFVALGIDNDGEGSEETCFKIYALDERKQPTSEPLTGWLVDYDFKRSVAKAINQIANRGKENNGRGKIWVYSLTGRISLEESRALMNLTKNNDSSSDDALN